MRSINTVIGQLRSGRLRYETLLQETLDKAATAKSAGDCSYVELMKEIAHLIRRHLEGIVASTQTRQTNGFIEAIDGRFQAAKRKARG
jgi:transposase